MSTVERRGESPREGAGGGRRAPRPGASPWKPVSLWVLPAVCFLHTLFGALSQSPQDHARSSPWPRSGMVLRLRLCPGRGRVGCGATAWAPAPRREAGTRLQQRRGPARSRPTPGSRCPQGRRSCSRSAPPAVATSPRGAAAAAAQPTGRCRAGPAARPPARPGRRRARRPSHAVVRDSGAPRGRPRSSGAAAARPPGCGARAPLPTRSPGPAAAQLPAGWTSGPQEPGSRRWGGAGSRRGDGERGAVSLVPRSPLSPSLGPAVFRERAPPRP